MLSCIPQNVSSSSNGAFAWDLQIGPLWSKSLSISGCVQKSSRKQKVVTSHFMPSAQNQAPLRAKKAFDSLWVAEWMDFSLSLFPVSVGYRDLNLCCIDVFCFSCHGDYVSSNATNPMILLVALIELGHYFSFRLSFSFRCLFWKAAFMGFKSRWKPGGF